MQITPVDDYIHFITNILTYHLAAAKPPPPPDSFQDEWDVVRPDDWYKLRSTTTFKRSEVLMITFVAKDSIRKGKVITRDEWLEGLVDAQHKGFYRVSSLEGREWEKVRHVVKCMTMKFNKKSTGFNDFLLQAKDMWRKDATDVGCSYEH